MRLNMILCLSGCVLSGVAAGLAIYTLAPYRV